MSRVVLSGLRSVLSRQTAAGGPGVPDRPQASVVVRQRWWGSGGASVQVAQCWARVNPASCAASSELNQTSAMVRA